jgi:serine protease Do
MARKIFVGGLGFILILTGLIALSYGKDHEREVVRQAVAVLHPGSGYLGVSISDIQEDDATELGLPAERGAFVEKVEVESPAEEAGIQQGDVVIEFDGEPVLSVRQFRRLVSETPAGREVGVKVWRAGSSLSLNVELGERTGGYRWFGADPEVVIEKKVVPEFHRDGHGIVFDGHDFEFLGKKPRLGIQVAELTAQMADFLGIPGREGVLVLETLPSTPAEKAGIRAGDVILSINERQVSSPGELIQHISSGVNTIELARDQQVSTVQVNVVEEKTESNRTLEM